MEKLSVYKYQAETIANALRMAMNALESRDGRTAMDRELIRADKMIKAVLEGNPDSYKTPSFI